MKWKEQVESWINNPRVQSIEITEWKSLADNEGDVEEMTFSHYPILNIKLIDKPVETTNERPKSIHLNYQIVDRVKKVIMGVMGCNSVEIKEDTQMYNLGADSLDHVEILMYLEREFNISIPDKNAVNMLTLRDMVEYLQKNNDLG